jgi:hypothetical protein
MVERPNRRPLRAERDEPWFGRYLAQCEDADAIRLTNVNAGFRARIVIRRIWWAWWCGRGRWGASSA